MDEEEIEGIKGKICRLLKEYDPDIVEIIQFGSSVYAPEYARDVDLLVITKKKKEYGTYLDATAEIYDELDFPYNIDIVPHEIGKELRKSFAVQIFGAAEVIYGDGSYLKKLVGFIDPTFEEARAALDSGKKHTIDSRELSGDLKDRYIRNAFNELFHAARLAAMSYPATENARWGQIKRRLPRHYRDEFEEFINVLHIDYFYNGNYPANYEEEFEKWYRKVEEFVSELEEKSGR